MSTLSTSILLLIFLTAGVFSVFALIAKKINEREQKDYEEFKSCWEDG